ncbi:TPA: hypothetical protein ACTM63_004375 [Yersinia enterocolitica]
MSWYEAGTVTSVAGTNVITGVGTLWNNPIFGIASGQMIFIPGSGQVVIYEILAVDSDTKIRITRNIAIAITNSEYAIVTTVSNSMSDLARRTAVQLALYQKLLEDWQDITTGTGDVTIIAPDGSTVVIPSLSDLTAWVNDSKTWFDDNRELIENAGEAVAGAETARDEAVAAKTAAQSAEAAAEGSATSASGSATTASDAAAAATDSASIASEAATIATQGKDGAVTARDEAEQFAESVNPDLLMHTTGGTFTGPVILAGDATDPKGAVTKQQLATEITALDTRVTTNEAKIATLQSHQKFVYLYPGGTEAAPSSIGLSQRLVLDSPFPGSIIECKAEALSSGIWGATGFIYSSSSGGSWGVSAAPINDAGKIVVQTGKSGTIAGAVNAGGVHGLNIDINAPSPYRIKVWTV